MSPAADKGSWQGELKPSVRSSGRNGAHFILMAIAFARTEELKNISEVVRRHRPEIGIESRRRVRYRLAEASDRAARMEADAKTTYAVWQRSSHNWL